MKKLPSVAYKTLLGMTLFLGGSFVGANINGYYNAKNEIKYSIEESPLYQKISESFLGETFSKRRLEKSRKEGFGIFAIGEKLAFEEYIQWCKECENVGVI